MGTMSRLFKTRRNKAVLTRGHRKLSGQLLLDVLTVIRYKEKFNRATRRAVFAIWRSHCTAVGLNMVKAIAACRGTVTNDSPAAVQARILIHCGKL